MNIPDDAVEAAGGAVYDALSHYGLTGTEADNVAEAALEVGAGRILAEELRAQVFAIHAEAMQFGPSGYASGLLAATSILNARIEELECR